MTQKILFLETTSSFPQIPIDTEASLRISPTGQVFIKLASGVEQEIGIIADNAITNAKLADMAQATFKMRASAAGTGDPIDGTPAQAKTALAIANTDVSGLGTMSTQAASAVAITGGSVTGITDLAIADGGTGSGTAPTARVALGLEKGFVVLPIPGGTAPDGTGTGNNPATPNKVVSSGGPTTNAPKVTYIELLFDGATEENWTWQFQLPSDYASGGTIRLDFLNKGTSSNGVVWKAAACCLVAGTTDFDTAVFDTVVTANATPSTTSGITTEATLALTMTNALAGRTIVVMIGRDPDNGSDTNTSDMGLVSATFEYVI